MDFSDPTAPCPFSVGSGGGGDGGGWFLEIRKIEILLKHFGKSFAPVLDYHSGHIGSALGLCLKL